MEMVHSLIDCLKIHCLVSNRPNTGVTMCHVITDEVQWEFESFIVNVIPNEVFQYFDEVSLHIRYRHNSNLSQYEWNNALVVFGVNQLN